MPGGNRRGGWRKATIGWGLLRSGRHHPMDRAM